MIHTLASTLRSSAFRSALAVSGISIMLVPSLSGCAIFVKALQAGGPAVEPAAYKNLAGQSVAVVVWAEDTGVRMDWPKIQIDTAQKIISKLQTQQKESKPDDLKLTRFPVAPGSVARFQEEHPEMMATSIEDLAPNFGVSRVIYVEIHNFQTRSAASNDLFRGQMSGSVRVVEVTNGKGRVTFTNDHVRVYFPGSSPEEGLPNLSDYQMYTGTLDGFTEEIAKLFAPHANDPDADYGTTAPAPGTVE